MQQASQKVYCCGKQRKHWTAGPTYLQGWRDQTRKVFVLPQDWLELLPMISVGYLDPSRTVVDVFTRIRCVCTIEKSEQLCRTTHQHGRKATSYCV